MNLPSSESAPVPPSPAPRRDWPRRLANAAVTLVVLAVAAGTFVLSYDGVHAIALQGGVSVQLARIYPGLFDAVLVIACVAAVMLRDARWWARGWAWLVVFVVLAAIGAADVLHAADYALRHRTTEAVVAGAPVVAVLLAFSLLLTMLRQSRPQPPATAVVSAPIDTVPVGAVPVGAVSIVAAGAVPRPPAPPIALPPAPAEADRVEPAAVPDQAPDAPAPIADTVEIPVFTADTGPADQVLADPPDHAEAPTREEPAPSPTAPASDTALLADVPATPVDSGAPDDFEAAAAPDDRAASEASDAPTAPDEPSPAAEPAEALVTEAPSSADADADADAAEPVAESSPEPEPEQSPQPTSQAIRYASSAAAAEYWESEVDPDLAGQVYPVLTSDPDIDTSGYPEEAREADDTEAAPFATAPFASVPRLNRMRVSPIPPTDGDEED
jgi:hypothetical protein